MSNMETIIAERRTVRGRTYFFSVMAWSADLFHARTLLFVQWELGGPISEERFAVCDHLGKRDGQIVERRFQDTYEFAFAARDKWLEKIGAES